MKTNIASSSRHKNHLPQPISISSIEFTLVLPEFLPIQLINTLICKLQAQSSGAYYGTLKTKIANSLGQRLGSIQLGEGKLATLFINPPLVAQPSGAFAKMSARKLESADISAVIENMSGGIGLEIAKLDLKNIVLNAQFEDESLSFADSEHLKKLSSHLLLRFGVDLTGYSKFKVAQAMELDYKA
jgi:hypothetical protein